jgi:hypothetical protein
VVYLSLVNTELNNRGCLQVHFVRPRGLHNAHVFRILIHISVVEELLFYHHPRNELLDEGKIPWREIHWQYEKANGELGEEDLHPHNRDCRAGWIPARRHSRDGDDDHEFDQKRPRSRGFLSRMSVCIDARVEATRDTPREAEGIAGTMGNHPKQDQGRLERAPPPPLLLVEGMTQLI